MKLIFGVVVACTIGLMISAGHVKEALSDQLDDVDNEEPSEFGVLFRAPGVEETYYACSACHSERIVAQQGLTRAHWDELLVWMVEEQEMDEIEEPDRTIILDYLAENYGEDRPNFPSRGSE